MRQTKRGLPHCKQSNCWSYPNSFNKNRLDLVFGLIVLKFVTVIVRAEVIQSFGPTSSNWLMSVHKTAIHRLWNHNIVFVFHNWKWVLTDNSVCFLESRALLLNSNKISSITDFVSHWSRSNELQICKKCLPIWNPKSHFLTISSSKDRWAWFELKRALGLLFVWNHLAWHVLNHMYCQESSKWLSRERYG